MSRFRAIPCFRIFPTSRVSERKNILCSAIEEIPFAFYAIKHRVFPAVWKVVRTSGAGQSWGTDTVASLDTRDNISILRI